MQKSHALIAVLVAIVLAGTLAVASQSWDSQVTVAGTNGSVVATTEPIVAVPTTVPTPAPGLPTGPTPTASPEPVPTTNAEPTATVAPAPTETAVAPTATPVPPSNVSLVLNSDLTPAVASVAPAIDGGANRPVGRFVDDEGVASDLVLGELVVATSDPAALDGFLQRHNATVINSITTTQSDIVDYLVNVPAGVVDAATAAARLSEVEPDHGGTYELSDSAIGQLIAIAATESSDYGLEVSLNWIALTESIADGEIDEDPALSDPFTLDYLRIGGSYDTGVTGAWQLLNQHNKLGNKVEVLVADGGFFENDDFPSERKIRLAGWNEQNPGSCGNPCPTHGTDVSLTAVGQVDNGFGVPGVAGPVGTLVAVQPDTLDIFSEFRKIRNVVEEERPDVVNMSFSAEIKLFRAASQASADRVIGDMVATGAIVFSSAGNDGKNIDGTRCIFGNCYENRLHIPCESKHSICVGGLRANGETGTWLHDGSNHGTAGGNRSVELYAPFCVRSLANFNSGTTKNVCGTSFSTPFTAGAAALILAANPSLDRHEIKSVLMDTAHVGGVHFDHYISTNDQRRVNVLDAVMQVLGVTEGAPTVDITSHDDFDQVTTLDWIDLEATAHDYKGQPLEVSWESSIEGDLGTSLNPVTVFELTSGTHTIIARVSDVNGIERSDSINLVVQDNPPEMTISWPPPGTKIYDGTDINLVGGSLDPDSNQFLDDDDVTWQLVRNGQVEYTTDGHEGFVSGNAMTPGTYTVVFTGRKGTIEGVAESTLKVQALPPGEDPPSALILTEFQDLPYGSYNGQPKAFTFDGIGTDPQDGVLSGTRMRWIAYSEGYERVLCTGSSWDTYATPEPEEEDDDDDEGGNGLVGGSLTFASPDKPRPPIVGADDFTLLKDCSSVDVELELLPQHPVVTHYTIVLQVRDSAGLIGQDIAALTLGYVTG